MKIRHGLLFKRTFWIFLILLCLNFIVSPVSGEEKKVLTFGIIPEQSASKLAWKWTPILDYISAKSGYKINLETAPDIAEFEKRLQNGEYDIAYMNPYEYTVFSKTSGYKVFAKQKGERLSGILVVRKNEDITSIKDLAGKNLVFPSQESFASSILTREHLLKNGIDIKPEFVDSDDSVYRAVANGTFPAGGGLIRTLNDMERDVQNQLRILWASKSYSPHAFASHPSVPDDVIKIILRVMVEMNNDPEASNLFRSIQCNGIEAANDSEWNDIRALKIKEVYNQKEQSRLVQNPIFQGSN